MSQYKKTTHRAVIVTEEIYQSRLLGSPVLASFTEADLKYMEDDIVCPKCGEQGVSGGEININAGRTTQEIECLNCGFKYQDIYVLVGYEEMENKDD